MPEGTQWRGNRPWLSLDHFHRSMTAELAGRQWIGQGRVALRRPNRRGGGARNVVRLVRWRARGSGYRWYGDADGSRRGADCFGYPVRLCSVVRAPRPSQCGSTSLLATVVEPPLGLSCPTPPKRWWPYRHASHEPRHQ